MENLRGILDLIPRLNITGDAKIMEFHAAATERLSHITPETMKDNDLVRSVAAVLHHQLPQSRLQQRRRVARRDAG